MAYRVRRGTQELAKLVDDALGDDRCLYHAHDGAVWWVVLCEEDGQPTVPVAYAGVKPAENHPGCLYSFACGVHPAHQGRRLQLALLKARKRYAAKLGMDLITYTMPGNAPSINSLVRARFRAWEPNFPWAGNDVCYWRYYHRHRS